MFNPGRRIIVCGATGTGKTTVAKSIARLLGLPHIELDAIFWTPGWVSKPPQQFRANVSAVLDNNPGGWVIDGNYSRVRDLILPLADTVVWLRPPFRVAFWRLFKRTVRRAWSGEILWGNNRESWRLSFLSRDSLLLYAITTWRRHHKKTRQAFDTILHHANIIELRSILEIEKFLAGLPATESG